MLVSFFVHCFFRKRRGDDRNLMEISGRTWYNVGRHYTCTLINFFETKSLGRAAPGMEDLDEQNYNYDPSVNPTQNWNYADEINFD